MTPVPERNGEPAALTEVRAAADHRRTAIADAEQRFRDAIRRALAVGVPATAIASAADITRGRVYQIRDDRR